MTILNWMNFRRYLTTKLKIWGNRFWPVAVIITDEAFIGVCCIAHFWKLFYWVRTMVDCYTPLRKMLFLHLISRRSKNYWNSQKIILNSSQYLFSFRIENIVFLHYFEEQRVEEMYIKNGNCMLSFIELCFWIVKNKFSL